jgi:hypothetical protein
MDGGFVSHTLATELVAFDENGVASYCRHVHFCPSMRPALR